MGQEAFAQTLLTSKLQTVGSVGIRTGTTGTRIRLLNHRAGGHRNIPLPHVGFSPSNYDRGLILPYITYLANKNLVAWCLFQVNGFKYITN